MSGRPPALQALVRRSDRRSAIAVVVLAVVLTNNWWYERQWHTQYAPLERTTAVVQEGGRAGAAGGGSVTVVLADGRRLATEPMVYDLPAAGEVIDVEVSAAAEPPVVRLADDPTHPLVDAALVGGPFLLCLLFPVGRRLWARHLAGLAAGPAPTYALVGRLRRRPIQRRGVALDLFAVDHGPGARPIASVPLASSGGLPLGALLPVEVKGTPRPYARLVARVGDVELWPSAPATAPGPRAPARPDLPVAAPVPLATVPPPPAGRLRPWYSRRAPWVLAGAVAATVPVTVIGLLGLATAAERLRTWPRVEAAVVVADNCQLTVELDEGEGHARTVELYDCAGGPVGPGYIALVDPEDPDHVVLEGGLYDAATSVGLLVLCVVGAGEWTRRTVVRDRRLRLAAEGRWTMVEAVVVHRGKAVDTLLRAPDDPPGAARATLRGNPLGLAPSWPRPVAVVPAPVPGEVVLLAHGQQPWFVEHRAGGA